MAGVHPSDTVSPFGTYCAEGWGRFAWGLADRREMSSWLRKRVRGLVARLFRGPYDAEAEGLRFRLYPGANYDDRKILARGRLPERAEHALIAPYLRPGVTFVDIGANVGSYSLDAARRGARVLAIEANPETAERLSYNIAANDLTKVAVEVCAVGPDTGTRALWSAASNCGFATLVEGLANEDGADDWRARRVDVRPLAEVLDAHGIARADVLKVDVEGFEDRALLPYLDMVPADRRPGAILLETNCRDHWRTDCEARLGALGYRAVGVTDDNTVFERAA